MRRLCAIALSILLAMGWLVSPLTVSTAQAVTPAKPSASPGHPVRGVAFSVAGRLPTKVARPVALQRKSGSKWVTIASSRTTSRGRYSFATSLTSSSAQLRVYAAKVKIGKKTYARLTSKVNTVRTVLVTPASPMPGETFTVVESLRKKGSRTAKLQALSGKKWVTIKTATSNRAGTVTFTASLRSSTKLRVYAPKTKIKKKTYAKITVASFQVATTAQAGSLSLPKSGLTGQALVAQATFSPARAGRTVELQQLSGSSWVRVATGTQDASGKATVAVAPSTEGTFTYRAVAVAYQGAPATATRTAQAAIASGVAEPSIVIGTLAPAVTGEPYDFTLDVVGGTGPFTWTATGLPEGMSLSSDGVLSGSPTTPGTYDITISLTDSRGKSAHTTTQIVVRPVVGIESDSLPEGIAGQDYTATLVGAGGTTPFHWTADGLPAGLSISDDGVISGVTNQEGAATVSVTVTDANGKTATKEFTLTTSAALALTTTDLPSGTVGTDYSSTLAATGGASPYTWSQSGLPDGLSLNETTGVISGTPTQAGTFDEVTLTVTDDNGYTATTTLTVVIAAAFAISTTSVPNGVAGTTYPETTLETVAGTAPFTWSSTTLPDGLSLSSDGKISGTPTTAGTFDAVTISVSDSADHTTQASFTITIAPAVHITTTSLPAGVVGTDYPETTLTAADGNSGSYFWTADHLPDGLNFNGNTGVLSGVPTSAGSFDTVTFTVTDEAGKIAEATYTITVAPAVHITTTSLPSGVVGTDYFATVEAADGAPSYGWTASGLPFGMSMNPTTGEITGSPYEAGTFDAVKITATDRNGAKAEATFTITIAPAVHITTTALSDAVLNLAYPETTLAAADGTGPYTWSATGLPTGVSVNATTGVLSGTPTESGSFSSVTITATDANQKTASASFSFTVHTEMAITTPQLPTAIVGEQYSATLAGLGGNTPYTWAVADLPDGLTLDTSTGAITGTPTTAGNVDLNVTLTDNNDRTDTKTLTLTVRDAVHVTTAMIPQAVVGTDYSASVSADGGTAPYSWTSTPLPAGLTLSQGGVLTGTPTINGMSPVTFTVTDSHGKIASAELSITIVPAVHITTTSLPGGVAGTTYPETTLTAADGNSGSYTWTSTTLPDGLSLSSSGTITGTPTSSGVYDNVKITVTDADGKTAEATYSVTINQAVHITTASLPDGVVGSSYPETTLTAADGNSTTYTWSSTTLPEGLSLSEAGVLSGTPTTGGTTDVTFTVTDADGKTAEATFTITITKSVHITTTSLPSVEVGDAYPETTLTAADGNSASYAWSSTTLPDGLSLSEAGVLSGTPTAEGTTAVTFTVTDADGETATAELTITITPAAHLTSTLSIGVVGGDYTSTLTASGGTAPYTITAGTLPDGLTYTDGTISGTPTTAVLNTPVEFTITDGRNKITTTTLGLTVTKPVTASSGSAHACAITPAGGVECWGSNTSGQLGDGTTTNSLYPVKVSGLDGTAISVAAGTNHTCALLDNGKVRCWGADNYGQLGNGSGDPSTTPVDVLDIDSAVSIAAGQTFTCVTLATGTASCWGIGLNGQLGNGILASSQTPVGVINLTGAIDVQTGSSHACALTATGSVSCWGRNMFRQLGAGIATSISSTPVAVPDVSGVVDLSAHVGNHTCVATDAGAVKCWGQNNYAQVGIAAGGNVADAVTVSDVTDAAQVVAGSNHSCAITSAGAMRCWGSNSSGQLGTNASGTMSVASVAIDLGATAASASAGTNYTCARTTAGTLLCWGSNSSGQLANGYASNSTLPMTVSALSAFSTIAVGDGFSCGLTAAGAAKCWGSNSFGQLGDGTTTNSIQPVQVSGLDSGVAAIDLGTSRACALTTSGGVKCWGKNSEGALGNGTQTDSSVPVTPTGLDAGVVSVSTADRSTCAVLTDGTARCWGENGTYQLGDGSNITRTSPVQVGNLTDAVSVSVGAFHACVITTSGGLKCWGGNSQGAVGDGTTNSPVIYPANVSGLSSGVTAVTAGLQSTCAVVDSAVTCWGYNPFGQVGDGGTTDVLTPNTVPGLSTGMADVSTGVYHTCARATSGAVSCWGFNNSGQLGDGTTTERHSPTPVTDLSGAASSITAGGYSSCAMLTDGTVQCWGSNTNGQLGALTAYNPTPAAPIGLNVAALDAGTASLPGGVAGTAYTSGPLTATGGVAPYTWTATGLPAGLSLSTDGSVSGTPTEAGTTEITFTVTDVRGKTANTTASITITPAVHITSDAALPGGVVGTTYSTQLTAADGTGPYTWSSDVVPAGLTLSQDGVLSGTPTAATASTTMQITATDHNGKTDTKAITIVITPVIHGAAAISAGTNMACAITDAGGAECWGKNQTGQLGDGTVTPDSTIPVPVSGLSSGVRAVTAGASHACALTDAGGVKCWGTNQLGQLGDGSTMGTHEDETPYISAIPVDVVGLTSGVKAISAGANHTCAITNAGAVKCWGYNANGGLGNDSTTNSNVPVDVAGLTSGVTAIAGNNSSTCAITSSGGVKCWGGNGNGQLGDGSLDNRLTPVDVALAPGVSAAAISAHGATACALTDSGAVACWGRNNAGQLGIDSTTDSATPVTPTGMDSGVAAVSVGHNNVCALTTAGGVTCAGDNYYGQLGDGTTTAHLTPAAIPGLSSGVASVGVGATFICARLDSGAVKCLGANDLGQGGNGFRENATTPTDVFGYGPVSLHIATSGLPTGEVGIAYPAAQINRAGGTTPYTWAATGLPNGLSINASTGVISGTPTEAGTFSAVKITLTDGTDATAETTLSLTTIAGVRVTTSSLPDGLVGASYAATTLAAADGTAPYVWSATGLPAGLSLDAGTGEITGTPTAYGVVSVAITATDQNQYAATTTVPLSVLAIAGVASDFLSIEGGSNHTCAVNNVGGVECWGLNSAGQLGDGTLTTSFAPVGVTGLSSGVAAVASGTNFTCALTNAGGVKCWGFNTSGQLGNGTTTPSTTPVDVSGLSSGVTAISAGSASACALTSTGGVKCWGLNANGQLGNGTTTPALNPIDVDGLTSGVTAISAGLRHNCAVTATGGAKCWGANSTGALGDDTIVDRWAPVDVTGLTSGVTAISAGNFHTCALTSTGGLKCWGYNLYGQLGNGNTSDSHTAVDVTGLTSGVTAVSVGAAFSCAITTGGGTICWGYNSGGQLGIGTTANSSTAVAVAGLASGVTAINAGGGHACALTSDHDVACWGTNAYGQVGNGQSSIVTTPVTATGLASGVATTAAGYNHTCALTSGGGVTCWGNNTSGQLGDGTTTARSTAAVVTGLASGITAVASGSSHSCALTTSGGVTCWGSNGNGQLGDGTTTDSTTPVAVTGLTSGVSAITAGGTHTCALTTTGGIKCWGNNFAGAVGNGTINDAHTPVDVSGLTSGVAAISAGGSHTCALTTTGGIKCWGYNETGELGNGTTTASTTPVDVDGLTSGATAVDAGGSQTCAITTEGGAKCWGYNNSGQLGDGTTTNSSTPVNVSGLATGVASINVGSYHACAVTSTGGIKCWGQGSYGQLGYSSTTSSSVPIDVTGLGSGMASISGGNQHTCAVTTAGAVSCWGINASGQLGNSAIVTLVPGAVSGHTFTPTT